MRLTYRLLAIVTITVLLAPSLRLAAIGDSVAACNASPRPMCACPVHHGSQGRVPNCCAAHTGQCGIESHDAYLASLLSALTYVPTEHRLPGDLDIGEFDSVSLPLGLLPSHAAPPDQPPRTAL
jgi:hypothetical protein